MKKEKEDVFTSVPVKDIVSESNRKIGGMGNIDILAEDIKQHGLTNPPTVVETEDGKYQVVAGRRRIEAARQLKWKEVTVKLISGDEDRLASIALSENVNRMEMHPLDEADYFKRLLEKGTKVQDIAATHDRTVSGIQHRIRLCDLVEGIKTMLREEKLDLPCAALLASLPEEDQEKFLKKFGEKEVGKWEVSNFIHSVQHCRLNYVADKQCAECRKEKKAREETRKAWWGYKDFIFYMNQKGLSVNFDSDENVKKLSEEIRQIGQSDGDDIPF